MQWLRSLVFTAFLFAWSFLYAVFFVLVSWTMPVPRRYRLAAWYARLKQRPGYAPVTQKMS